MEIVSENKCFDGQVQFIKHQSSSVKTPMTFSVFIPPQAALRKVPVLYFLSGLTCTAENFTFKAGAFKKAAELGLMIVCPDTSPRGAAVNGEDERYDLGSGAGFYVDATTAKWREHYQMYSYVTQELPEMINENFNVDTENVGVMGHSMGGHGALICALKNPSIYKSVSAFAPICAPSQCPWGELAFTEYLGDNREDWRSYDATELIKTQGWTSKILIDQGGADQFLGEQLKPELFAEACKEAQVDLSLNIHPGYDHSYYFISSYVERHLEFHAEQMNP
jgi:S-formylglutathione hydrolase